MLAPRRHEIILETIRREGSVRVRDLVEQLGISDMTVRRDLDLLDESGLLVKVHGGATRVSMLATEEPGFDAKRTRQADQKTAIARAAAELVQPGFAVGLTAGTTTWQLANSLLSVANLTVITNSPSVAQVFYRSGDHSVTAILTGGMRTPSDALVGPIATAALSQLHLDVVFMGVHGMDPVHGYSTPNLAEAETNRAFVASARRLVVVADHTKWMTPGLATITALADADVVVTGNQLDADARQHFDAAETELLLVDARPATLEAEQG
ncbi:MAG: DeoR/GlpR family DNA-binding transcription regulator [Acidimicrobiales bacterium]